VKVRGRRGTNQVLLVVFDGVEIQSMEAPCKYGVLMKTIKFDRNCTTILHQLNAVHTLDSSKLNSPSTYA
jgi:hypothetical protein